MKYGVFSAAIQTELWDSNVWAFILVIGILFAGMILAHMLKRIIPFLNKMLMPASVLGGLIILIFTTIYQLITKDVFFDLPMEELSFVSSESPRPRTPAYTRFAPGAVEFRKPLLPHFITGAFHHCRRKSVAVGTVSPHVHRIFAGSAFLQQFGKFGIGAFDRKLRYFQITGAFEGEFFAVKSEFAPVRHIGKVADITVEGTVFLSRFIFAGKVEDHFKGFFAVQVQILPPPN